MPDNIPAPFDQGLFLIHLNRGKEHLEKGNLPAAEQELEEARRMRPSDDKVLNLLGLVYFKQDKHAEADEIYRLLILANPESLPLHFNHGLICFKLGKLDQAEAAFLRALEIKPDNPKIHFYLGNIYERKKQYYNAIFQYRKAGANIMVKRVQAKIASDPGRSAAPAPTAEAPGEASAAPPPAPSASRSPETQPRAAEEQRKLQEQMVGDLLAVTPERSLTKTDPAIQAGDEEDLKVTVDHIDKKRFLATLLGGPEGGAPAPPDVPPTVVRHREPVESDASFSEIARPKVLSGTHPGLFAPGAKPVPSPPPPPANDDTVRLGTPPVIASGPMLPYERRGANPVEPEDKGLGRIYTQLRRRDDTFRYLENNLMEVNFSGKIYIKQGTIYSYTGNLTFWVKPQREDEVVPPLVIVSGTGKLLLTDGQREISVMHVNGEEVLIEPSHLLACEETLTPRYAIIEREGANAPRLHVLALEGTGMVALSVRTRPLLLNVSPGYPVNVSSGSIISWSGSLVPTIVDDEALAELMLPHIGGAVNLRLEGTGKVMMERSSPLGAPDRDPSRSRA
jgi:uncharacterized protein (AIM24 family)